MDLMYGCGSEMDMSIQELFEQDMQNEINRMMSSDLGIDDLMGDSTPLFQGLTEDGFDEFDLCFESSNAESSITKGADLFDPLGNKKAMAAVVNVPLKSQVSSSNSRNSNGTTTVTIIKGSNTQSSLSTVTKNASASSSSSTVTIKQNGLGRPNVHRFGTQTRTIVTTTRPNTPPPMQYVRVLSSTESMPKTLSFDESYGGVMVSPTLIALNIANYAFSAFIATTLTLLFAPYHIIFISSNWLVMIWWWCKWKPLQRKYTS